MKLEHLPSSVCLSMLLNHNPENGSVLLFFFIISDCVWLMTMNEFVIRTEYLTLASCWVKGNGTWIFFTAFSLYKPQICCWVTQPLPLFLWDQAVEQGEAKQCRGCCGLQTAGTVLTVPLAPVGGRQRCWLNKQGHHPALTAVMNRELNQSASCSWGGQETRNLWWLFLKLWYQG